MEFTAIQRRDSWISDQKWTEKMQEYAKHVAQRMLSTFWLASARKKSLYISWNRAEKYEEVNFSRTWKYFKWIMTQHYFIRFTCDVKNNYADLGGNILLNPSTTDGCREGTWWNWRELQASAEGNHENPVSGTTRHHHTENLSEEMHRYSLKHIQREGKAGGKTQLKLLHRTATWAKWLTSESAVKLLKPRSLKPKTTHIRWRPLARIALCLTSPNYI